MYHFLPLELSGHDRQAYRLEHFYFISSFTNGLGFISQLSELNGILYRTSRRNGFTSFISTGQGRV